MGCGASKHSNSKVPVDSAQSSKRRSNRKKNKNHKETEEKSKPFVLFEEDPEDASLSPHERYIKKLHKYRELFDEMDVDGTNTLSVVELKNMFKGKKEKDFVMKWLAMFDDDSSGEISWPEFMEAMDKQERVDAGAVAVAKAEEAKLKAQIECSKWMQANGAKTKDSEMMVSKDLAILYLTNAGLEQDEAVSFIRDAWEDIEISVMSFDDIYPLLSQAKMEKALQKNRHKYRKIVKEFAKDFKKLDKDGDGKLSKDEIRASVLGGNQEKLSEAMDAVSKLLKADINGDGSISWHEFLAYMEESNQVDDPSCVQKINTIYGANHMRKYNDKLKQYRIYFLQADKDGNGILSRKEVKKMLSLVGTVGKSTKAYLKQWDLNGDNMISWDEFLASMDSTEKMVVVENNDKHIIKFFEKYYDIHDYPEKQQIKFYHLEAYFIHVEHVKDTKKAALLANRAFNTLGQTDILSTVDYPKLYLLLVKRSKELDLRKNKKVYRKQLDDFAKKFKRADADNDGKISREEFADLLADKSSCESLEQAAAAATKLIGKIDDDGSGFITWEEFQKYMEARESKKKSKKKKR